MSKSHHVSSSAAVPRKRKRTLVRRVAHGALFALSLTTVQLMGGEELMPRMFDPGLVDRLKEPLTRHHE